jgi:predicted DNA-binding protein (MmcQ/YjbR family)
MTIESVREFCLGMDQVTESFPFNEDALVFKVMGKMFLLMSLEERTIALKCDPEKALALREEYDAVLPGYHFNKKYWNTVLLEAGIPDRSIRGWILDSYNLVVEGLPKKLREQLREQ